MIMEFGERLNNCIYRDRFSVYALIFNEDGKLAITYVSRKDAYFLPGGGIEQGENHVECVKRECREEIGMEIEVNDYFCHTVVYQQNERLKTNLKVIGDFYFSKIVGDSDTQVEEEHELLWLDPNSAIRMLTLENQAWAVKKALEMQNGRSYGC